MNRWSNPVNIIYSNEFSGSSIGYRTGKTATTFNNTVEYLTGSKQIVKSISFWINFNDTTIQPQVISALSRNDGTKAWVGPYGTTSGGKEYIPTGGFGTSPTSYTNGVAGTIGPLDAGTWYFVTITDATGSAWSNGYIGYLYLNSVNFIISDLIFYNIQLTSDEVLAMYNFYRTPFVPITNVNAIDKIEPIDFTISEVIGKVLQNNIIDIKKNRKGERFVFPEFATNDENLPQITVKIGEPGFENASAGDVFYQETLENFNYREYFYKKATVPFTIYVLTTKDAEYEVVYNNKKVFMKNKMICNYWSNSIVEVLRQKRKELLLYFDNFRINKRAESYEANAKRWTTEITGEIIIKDKWMKEYHEGELIAEYTLTPNLYE